MTDQDYYRTIFDRLQRTCRGASYVIGAGTELIQHGWRPGGLLVAVEPVDQLWKMAVEWGLQIHVPVIGANCERVLMPMDFEISLSHENFQLYNDMQTQHHYFRKYLMPATKFLESFFIAKQLPFLLDLTPSGGHILFWVEKGTKAWAATAAIGYLDEDLTRCYQYRDPGDIKRRDGIDLAAGRVFSGLGRLSEFIGYIAKNAHQSEGSIPVTICDSEEKSINYDNSWAGDAAFMRGIRTPFSLHKKNIQKYGMYWQPPLVDVLKTYYDGTELKQNRDFEYLLNCMWSVDKAVQHATDFSGIIPRANDSLAGLIELYKKSGLHAFHQQFDAHPGLPRGAALARALKDASIHHNTRKMIDNPYPAMLQPINLKRFVGDLVLRHSWHPKEVACLIRDLYEHPQQTYWGKMDWFKSPSTTKAEFYGRLYGGMALWECGQLELRLPK